MLNVENTDTSLGFRICFSVRETGNVGVLMSTSDNMKGHADFSWYFSVLTSSRAEVDQQELVSGAKLVAHSSDHFSPSGCHCNPDCRVGVITAVHLQEDCTQANSGLEYIAV